MDTREPPAPTGGAGESFRERVLAVVRAIPHGRVATYGQVALLAGAPRAARQVGGILFRSAESDDVPWQRVVNASGGISTHKVGAGTLQEALLRSEGVEVDASGVDLRRYRWQVPVSCVPEPPEPPETPETPPRPEPRRP